MEHLRENGEQPFPFSTEIAEKFPNLIALIEQKFPDPKPTSVKYEVGSVWVFVGEKGKEGSQTWKELKLTGSNAAEAYLSSLERFDAAVNTKTEGFMFKIAQVVAKWFNFDIQDWIRDKGFFGWLARFVLQVDIPEKDIPKISAGLSKNLDALIAKRGGTALEAGKLEGAASEDKKVKYLLKDLGVRFNQEDTPIEIVESKTEKVTDPKDEQRQGETAGRMLLWVNNPDTAAAIVRYAQRRSSGFADLVKKGVGTMGGGLGDFIKGVSGNEEAAEQSYIARSRWAKFFPDNIATSYKGVADGGFQVQILWFSDANLVPISTPQEETEEGAPAAILPDEEEDPTLVPEGEEAPSDEPAEEEELDS